MYYFSNKKMSRRFVRFILALSLVSLCVCLYAGEVGIYDAYAAEWRWPTHAHARDPASPLASLRYKILILSDPHIQCSFDRYEPWLARWDSDRHVGRLYGRLVERMRPDLVVVLGDVFAEGYKASHNEWEEYLQVRRRRGRGRRYI